MNDKTICKFCNKEFKSMKSRAGHQGFCHDNPNKVIVDRSGKNNPMFGKKGGNRFTKNPNYKISDETREKLSKASSGKKWSAERKKNQSKRMLEVVRANPDSYMTGNKGGRTKIYEYKGFKLRGTWELEVAKYLDQSGIEWTNKVQPFDYRFEGKQRLYFPDFYLPELDMYIEVKGFETVKDHAKWKVVDNLLVLKLKEIDEIKKGMYTLSKQSSRKS